MMETWQGGAINFGSSYSLTSYYMRKFMGDFEAATNIKTHNITAMFRYAEYLNFAEAEKTALVTLRKLYMMPHRSFCADV